MAVDRHWALPIASLLLTACGARQIEVHPAQPLPEPPVAVPKAITDPVEQPSWMQSAPLALRALTLLL